MPSSSWQQQLLSFSHAPGTPTNNQEQIFRNQLGQNIRAIWNDQLTEICGTSDLQISQSMLPLSHVKKIMKSNEEVKEPAYAIQLDNAVDAAIKKSSVKTQMDSPQKKTSRTENLNSMVPIKSNEAKRGECKFDN
ncbi:uncharacterized protein LOC127258437 [Andrographis paniculata]|uniref:uncharacterized protein LOC127258437 n=1 Tax=Andrographis paniculata TaxID=175694 RepID=UPI0021E80CE8|nr:uncharacterized protein LOC127258437 [Andrographis paniculata]